jgi:hypothetical protein
MAHNTLDEDPDARRECQLRAHHLRERDLGEAKHGGDAEREVSTRSDQVELARAEDAEIDPGVVDEQLRQAVPDEQPPVAVRAVAKRTPMRLRAPGP